MGASEKRGGYLEGNGWLVGWCVGHLVELAPADAYDPKYSKWRYGSGIYPPAAVYSNIPLTNSS